MSNKFLTLTSHLPNVIRIDKEDKSMATYLISIQTEVEQGRIALLFSRPLQSEKIMSTFSYIPPNLSFNTVLTFLV
jgi:hypothetical protein